MANDIDVPDDADKELFAIDVIQFFLDTCWDHELQFPNFHRLDEVEAYRGIVYNGFNFTMEKALEFTHDALSQTIGGDFSDVTRSEEDFRELTSYFYRTTRLMKGFEANDFIRYCTYVAVLSCCFYANDMKEAPQIAVELITTAFPIGKMSTDTWNILNVAAENLTKLRNDVSRKLSPCTSSDSLYSSSDSD